jgi:drug/metabolite transporter (DMT)-like permease
MALGTLLLLISAILHASWNALAKSSQDKEGFLFITILISGILTIGLAFGIDDGLHWGGGVVIGIGVLSGIFEGLYFITLSKALRESLGTSYAIMRGGAMVVVWLISSLFLGEVSDLHHYIGAGIILAGIFAMTIPRDKNLQVQAKKANNMWAYLSAFFIAGYHLCYHQALIRSAHPTSLFCVAMFVSLPFLFWSLGREPKKRILATWRDHPVRVTLCGIAAMASFVIFLYGLKVSAPGYAISLRNSSIFFALVFSYFLKEKISRVQFLGALTVGVGTIVLSF